jgi:UDP-N-acetylglucosamine 2-epimerase
VESRTPARNRSWRVGFVFGTRPEAIKLAPVVTACRDLPELEPVICVTAQHRKLLDQVLRFFEIEPHRDLDLMRDGQDLSGFAARALASVGTWLDREEPDALVVQGDTTTAFMATLAAYHRRVPVAHVEAGLRTHTKYEPWPEEGNRRLIDHLCDWHFAPTESAAANLIREGLDPGSVHMTGNTVVDAVLHVAGLLRGEGGALPVDLAPERRLITATMHRRENFGDPMRRICSALRSIADRHPEVEVVVPVHPNPNVRTVVEGELRGVERIRLIEPPDYRGFVSLLSASDIVMTDSGGVQEEAPVLGKPVLVLRRITERSEGVEAGAAIVVGDSPEKILFEVKRLLSEPDHYNSFAQPRSPYGDGHAAIRIACVLRDTLGTANAAALRAAIHGGLTSRRPRSPDQRAAVWPKAPRRHTEHRPRSPVPSRSRLS